MERETANDRFKRRHYRVKWAAIALAVVLHAGLLLFTPAIPVDFGSAGASGPRLIVSFSEWAPPRCGTDCGANYVPYDTSDPPPVLRNGSDLNRRLSHWYPPAMWRHGEPSSITYMVFISGFGRVHDARLLESNDDASDEALGFVVHNARFERGRALVANVRVSAEAP